MIDISVIIVNYNTAELTKDCIESVLKQEQVNFEIIVVDNASTDNTATVLQQFKNKITLILNRENLGFGKANNQAAKIASGKYIFLLNPDARLQDTDALQKIVSYMSTHSEYGLIGTKIVSVSGAVETKPKQYYPGERHINSPYLNLPGKIAWIIGASMIFPAAIYQQLNGFDEDFFLYGEDVDICLRVRKMGLEVGYLEDVVIVHVGRASECKTGWYELTTKKQNALLLFYQKHFPQTEIEKLFRYKKRQAAVRKFIYGLLVGLGFKKFQRKYECNKAISE